MAQKLENIAPLTNPMARAIVLMSHGRLHRNSPSGAYRSNFDAHAPFVRPAVVEGLRDRHLVNYNQGTRYAWLNALGKKALKQLIPRMCRRCGCTDDHACPEGCSWVGKPRSKDGDLCTACVV